MEPKLPYYMMYSVPLLFDEEKAERRDYEYLKSMYPDLAKQILPFVEEECDRYEYDESMIYDEYPDKLQLRLMAGRIYNQMNKNDDEELRNMIEVLLFQELLKRRTDRRRRKKKVIW